MRRFAVVVATCVTLTACSGTLGLDLPTEVEYYSNVLTCAEEKAGKDFGEITEDPDFEGLASGDSHVSLTGARLHDATALQECIDQGKPEVPDLDPVTGYGDFSDQAYADIDWVEVTALEVECANDNGAPLQVGSGGIGISGLNNAGGHLQEVFEAILDACREGLNLPEFSDT